MQTEHSSLSRTVVIDLGYSLVKMGYQPDADAEVVVATCQPLASCIEGDRIPLCITIGPPTDGLIYLYPCVFIQQAQPFTRFFGEEARKNNPRFTKQLVLSSGAISEGPALQPSAAT